MPDYANRGRMYAMQPRFKNILIGLSMLAAAAFAVLFTPHAKLADQSPPIDLETAIPKGIGDWALTRSIAQITTPELQKEIERIYSQTVDRTYVNSKGQMIMLSVAYGSNQTRTLRAHNQQYCYQSQGFQIRSLADAELTVDGVEVPVVRMVADNGMRVEPVTYWFIMGDYWASGSLDRNLIQIKYALTGVIPDGYLFRVSSIGANAETAFEIQHQFIRQLLGAVTPALRQKLLGTRT